MNKKQLPSNYPAQQGVLTPVKKDINATRITDSVATPVETLGSTPQEIVPEKKEIPAKRYADSIGELMKYYDSTPVIPLLWKGIKAGTVGFVFGVPKSGKTTLMEHFLLSIAAGKIEFLGYPLNCANRKCLFVSYEENTHARIERNRIQRNSFTIEEQELINRNFILSNQELAPYVLNENDWSTLEEELAFHKPGLVVIDSLSRLTLDDNGDETVAKRIMMRLKGLSSKYECTLIIINHTPKGAEERFLSIGSMSGSRIFMSEADFLIGVNRTLTGKRYIKLVASRYDKDDDEHVDVFMLNSYRCIEILGQELENRALSMIDGRIDNTNRDEVVQAIMSASTDSDGVARTKDLKYLYNDDNNVMSKVTFHACLKTLQKEGKVEKVGKGNYRVKST